LWENFINHELPAWARENLEACFYLQATVLGQGYDDFGLLRPVGQDLGGFKDFKGGSCFSGGKDYPVLVYSVGVTAHEVWQK
jgi:hypothetical protein